MDKVFGLHNWPEAKAGTFLWRTGPVMAAVGFFDIVVTGLGSHGASPHQRIDPIVVSAQIIGALQTIVSRSIEPIEGGVVSIGSIAGGDAYNILPERVVMKGTARWYRAEVGDQIESWPAPFVKETAESSGATAEVRFFRHAPATVNDVEATALATDAARAVAGATAYGDAGADDGRRGLRLHAERQAGCLPDARWRSRTNDPLLHHPRYDFNDEIFPVGRPGGRRWWNSNWRRLRNVG